MKYRLLYFLHLLFFIQLGIHNGLHASTNGYPFRANVTETRYLNNAQVATKSGSILVDKNKYKVFYFDVNTGPSELIQVEDRHYVIDTKNRAVYRGFMGIGFDTNSQQQFTLVGGRALIRDYQHQTIDGKKILSGWKEYENNKLKSEVVFDNFRLNSQITTADFKPIESHELSVSQQKIAYEKEKAKYTADYNRRQAESDRNWRPNNNPSSGFGIQSVGPPSLPYSPPQAPNYLNFQGSIQTQPGNGIAYTANPNAFSRGDISLTQAAVSFTEVDLELPGKNGLNLKISRTYNSRDYQSTTKDTLYKGQWGGGLGSGWHLGIAKRAYIVNFVGGELGTDIISIENGGGSMEFYYGKDHGIYSSPIPGNHNKASRIPGGIKLQTTTGVTLVFKESFYFDRQNLQYHDDSGLNWPREEWLKRFADSNGYYLSYIEDPFGNRITYEYEKFADKVIKSGAKHSVFEGLHDATENSKMYLYGNRLSHISNYMHTVTKYAEFYHFDSHIERKRLKTITDTFNRKVHVGYDDTWNLSPKNEHYYSKVSNIRYTDTTGKEQKIKYKIDTSGRLEGVQNGDLPEKKYEYSWFKSGINYIFQLNKGQLFRIHSREFDFNSHVHSISNPLTISTEYSKYDGAVLKKIIHPTGSETHYGYTPQLQHNYKYDPEGDEQRLSDQNTNIGFAAPAVIQKKIYESINSSPLVYNFYYNGQNKNIRNKATQYLTFGTWSEDHNSYYYKNVHIDNPAEIENEGLWFIAGRLHRKKIGNREEIHDYDMSTPAVGNGEGDIIKKTKETYLMNNVVQSQIVYNTHDKYLNFTQMTRYVGNKAHAREDVTYETSSTILDQNIVSLLKTKTITALQDNTSLSTRNDYTNKGKIKATYDTTKGKRTLLKEYTYDINGRVLTDTQNGVSGKLRTHYTYSNSGGRYKVTKTTNGKTALTFYELNTGLPVETQDINGKITRTQYDSYGRPTQITYPDGNSETQTYSSNLKNHTRSYLGKTVTKKADNFGRITEVNYSTSKEDEKVDYYYASKPSRLYKKENGNWVQKTGITYDTYLRPVTITDPHFGTTQHSYNDSQKTQTTTDPQGRSKTTFYNSLAQITKTETRINNSGIDTTLAYTYNGIGNATQFLDARGLKHDADYDEKGRIIHTYFTYKSAGKRPRSQTDYHATGEVKSNIIFNRNGSRFKTSSYTYDIEGRITEFLYNGQVTTRTTYDNGSNAKGRITQVDTPTAKHSYEYDSLGRATAETVINKSANNQSTTHAFTYNNRHNLSSSSYPDGSQLNYTYDDEDRLKTVTYKNTQIVNYAYNSDGKVSQMTYGNGSKTNYTYSKNILVDDIKITRKDGTPIYNEDLKYDSAAKITQTIQTDTVHPTFQLKNTATDSPNRNISYTYTGRNELKTVTYDTDTNIYSFKYDNNGNWITFANKKENGRTPADTLAQNFFPDSDSDQLERRNYKEGYITLKYDPDGNIIEKKIYKALTDTKPEKTLKYSYNYQGQLEKITEIAANNTRTEIANYTYDANRHRIWNKTKDKAIQHYFWQGETHIATGTAAQTVTEKYIYSGNEKIALIQKNTNGTEEIFYLHNNLQGSTVLITDENQDIRQRTQLDPYGNIETVITQNNLSEHIYYTGKAYDHTTGLYYFNQRYYDPDLGRFLTEDPAGQYVNPYLYAGNNPISFIDPNGEEAFSFIALATAVIKGAAIAAAVNASIQYAVTGTVDLDSVGEAAIGGAIGGALFYGVGSFTEIVNLKTGSAAFAAGGSAKVGLHAAAGGLSSSLQGGDFISGAIGAGVAEGLGGYIPNELGDAEQIFAAAGIGGVSSFAAGGSFLHGAMAGGFGRAFNHLSEGHRHSDNLKTAKANRDSYNLQPKTESDAIAQGWVKQSWYRSIFHKIGVPVAGRGGSINPWANVKYLDQTNHLEAVYNNNGNLVKGINGGTYNIFPDTWIKHTRHDMVPFLIGQ